MPKKRISVTLDEGVVERVDEEASSESLNRSQMIEKIVKHYFEGRSVDTAVVLCGDEEARSLDTYEGRPVLEHILDHISGQVSRVMLLIGKNTEIKDRFGSVHGETALHYIEEDDPRGTAAALRSVEDEIDDTFAVLNGHVLSDVNLEEISELHREEGYVATIALTTVEDPSSYGVARLKGSRILGFEEKPKPGEEPSRLINAGTYILEPEIFEHLKADSLEEVFEELASKNELSGYIYGGYWKDIEEN